MTIADQGPGNGYRIAGRVIDPVTGAGRAGLLVRAADRERYLGEGTTQEDGAYDFPVAFSAEDFSEFLDGERPVLLTVERGEEQLLSGYATRAAWDLDAGQLYEEIALELPDATGSDPRSSRRDGSVTASRTARFLLELASGADQDEAAHRAGLRPTVAAEYLNDLWIREILATLRSAPTSPPPAPPPPTAAGPTGGTPPSGGMAPTVGGNGSNGDTAWERLEEIVSYLPLAAQAPPRATLPTGSARPSLQQIADDTLADVLGRRVGENPQEYLAALQQVFVPRVVDGKATFAYVRRPAPKLNDHGARLTIAQASFSRRFQNALDDILPLLDGLVPTEDADGDLARVERALARTELLKLGQEIGRDGGWRASEVTRLFSALQDRLNHLEVVFGLEESRLLIPEDAQHRLDFQTVCDYIDGLESSFARETARLDSAPDAKLEQLRRELDAVPGRIDSIVSAMDAAGLGPEERRAAVVALPGNRRVRVDDLLSLPLDFHAEVTALIEQGSWLGAGTIATAAQAYARNVRDVLTATADASQISGLRSPLVRRFLGDLAAQLAGVGEVAVAVDEAAKKATSARDLAAQVARLAAQVELLQRGTAAGAAASHARV